jgi:SAM-dependent methyltransferase
MDLRILSRLRCPVSGAPLRLTVLDAERRGERDIVRAGILYCDESKLWYPLHNYVPVLLTFPTRFAERFHVDHAAAFKTLSGYRMPELAPMAGEVSVQKTFTEEWNGLGRDERTFAYSDRELVALHRDVWLQFTAAELNAVDSVLNVGVGFGKESEVLAEIFPNAEVFAVDLNFSLLAAASGLLDSPRVHPVIASLFRLPFAPGSFAHVHSQGVIHHTYSTKHAFDAISALIRPNGSLFIWVYAQEDSHVVPGARGALIRLYWLVSHRIGRPILSRLPAPLRNASMALLAAIIYPIIKLRDRRGDEWHFRNTLHGLRDAFTPRYAHQHGFNEVLMWFEDAGLEPKLQSPSRYRDLIGKRLIGIGIVGRRRPSALASQS